MAVAVDERPLAAVQLAGKLVGMAREQRDALRSGRVEQFEWISRRRNEITIELQKASLANVEITPAEAQHIEELQRELASVDGEMLAYLQQRLDEVTVTGKKLRRFQRAISPYFSTTGRAASFVDKTR